MSETVWFWRGGAEKGQWHHSMPAYNRAEAVACRDAIIRGGRPAVIARLKPDTLPIGWCFKKLAYGEPI